MKCPSCGHEWNSRAKVDSPIGEIISFFEKWCADTKHFKPVIDQTKDISAISRLLKKMPKEEIMNVITHFLSSDKSDKVGITLCTALSTHSVNMYLQSKGVGNGIDRYKRVIRNQGSGNAQKT